MYCLVNYDWHHAKTCHCLSMRERQVYPEDYYPSPSSTDCFNIKIRKHQAFESYSSSMRRDMACQSRGCALGPQLGQHSFKGLTYIVPLQWDNSKC